MSAYLDHISMTGTSADDSFAEQSFTSTLGFWTAVEAVVPGLRGQARRLVKNEADVDDLVQETLLKAWRARDQFVVGTNLQAWMRRIARNQFLTERRRARVFVELDDTNPSHVQSVDPAQEAGLLLEEVGRELARMSPEHRAALTRRSLHGESYDEAASTSAVKTGTMRSRVSRARKLLRSSLDQEPSVTGRHEPRSDPAVQSTLLPMPACRQTTGAYQRWKQSGSRTIG